MFKHRHLARAVTLTELLVVLSIMVVLLGILAPALGTFSHTSRVIASADTLSSMFRQARFYAMSQKMPVVPMILKNQKGDYTAVYAAKIGSFKGSFGANEPFKDWTPAVAGAVSNPFSLSRQSKDLPKLEKGAFVFWVGAPTLNLNLRDSLQPYYELMFMQVTPPADERLINDSSQYTYRVIKRGLHNTAYGQYDRTRTDGVDLYMVIGSEVDQSEVAGLSQDDARAYTISGISLPNHITVDVAENSEGRVLCAVTAQAAVFQEKSFGGWAGEKYPPTDHLGL
jgi:type II secretory pathway pseudopilin PulG